MRWATVILGAIVAGAIGWAVAVMPYHQSYEVSATIAGILAATVVAAGTKWANDDGRRGLSPGATVIGGREPLLPGPTSTQPDHAATTSQPPAAPQLVVGDLPAQAVSWQDRVELVDRLTVMAGHARTVVVCAVTGQRGIGKTQLAAAYARARVAEGWPVVVWVVADNLANLINGLTALAEAARVRQPDTDPSDAARAALAWLRTYPGPCLLVYDNALDPDLIQDWIPTVGAVHTVITTTRHDFGNLGEPLDVTLFTHHEAITYLRDRTGLTDDASAALVAEQLGWLPLALACAGAVIGVRRRYRTYQAYLDRLATTSATDLLSRPAGHSYPNGAAEAILLALDDLAANDPGGHARALLDRLAVLAPTGADSALLAQLAADGDDDCIAAAILAERSLTLPTTDTNRTVVHRLVQRVVCDHNRHQGRLDPILIDTADRLDTAASDISEQWTTRTNVADYAQQAEQLANHPAGQTAVKRLLSLRISMVYHLNLVHNFTAAIALGENMVTDCDRVFGPNSAESLRSRNNLAYAYEAVGRLDEAITLHEAVLADCERVLGPDSAETLRSRNNVASAYETAGRRQEAIALYQATLADRERVLGSEDPATLRSRNNLAYAYRKVGRLDEAIILYQATLADRERVLGPNHPDTLHSRSNLAGAYQEVGRLDEAIILYQATLADRERVLDPDHVDTLVARNNLANAYWVMGRLDEAIALYQAVLADSERVLGPDHHDTLLSRSNLAYAYRKVARLDQAIDAERSKPVRQRSAVTPAERPPTPPEQAA